MNNDELISLYYKMANAALVSPHSLRKSIVKGENDYLLVDVRSRQEYEKAHIVGAYNVPAYSSPDQSAYDNHQGILAGFNALPAGQQIVLYCYSSACMSGKKVGQLLADNGVFAKHLAIGWNEWRYAWNKWNHEHEWSITNVEDFISSGSEPGKYSGPNDDQLSCLC